MAFELERRAERTSLGQFLYLVFLRMIAMVLLIRGLVYWLQLSGLMEPELRFDVMPEHWQVASASMAVILPVAALGLWGNFPWGVVIWIIAAVSEVYMYQWRADLFGSEPAIVIFYASTLFLFIAFKALGYFLANSE